MKHRSRHLSCTEFKFYNSTSPSFLSMIRSRCRMAFFPIIGSVLRKKMYGCIVWKIHHELWKKWQFVRCYHSLPAVGTTTIELRAGIQVSFRELAFYCSIGKTKSATLIRASERITSWRHIARLSVTSPWSSKPKHPLEVHFIIPMWCSALDRSMQSWRATASIAIKEQVSSSPWRKIEKWLRLLQNRLKNISVATSCSYKAKMVLWLPWVKRHMRALRTSRWLYCRRKISWPFSHWT